MPDRAILVTGAAGFIGFHVAQRLLQSGRRVIGLDDLNTYYDPQLKAARLSILENDKRFHFERTDLIARRKAIRTGRVSSRARHQALRHGASTM
jgi:UDP-glucuronate 4-epimerase